LQLAQLSWADPGQIVRDVTFQSDHFQHLKWWPFRHLIPLSGRTISAILHFPLVRHRGGLAIKLASGPASLLQLQQQQLRSRNGSSSSSKVAANAAKRVQVYGLEASQFGPLTKKSKELARSQRSWSRQTSIIQKRVPSRELCSRFEPPPLIKIASVMDIAFKWVFDPKSSVGILG